MPVNWSSKVEPKMMFAMLEHMKTLTGDNATFFLSTPCWNRTDCAANHVNEMLYEALGAAFERHGFMVDNVYGTFASIRDYQDQLQGLVGGQTLFDQLRDYYDSNFLSCIFAPLFPGQSRNCLWELSKCHLRAPGVTDPIETSPENLMRLRGIHKTLKFPPIEQIQEPWSSSANWKDMAL